MTTFVRASLRADPETMTYRVRVKPYRMPETDIIISPRQLAVFGDPVQRFLDREARIFAPDPRGLGEMPEVVR